MLYVIDFDFTIVDANTHNIFSRSSSSTIEELWCILKEIPPIGGREAWLDTFKTLIDHDHQISIASFNSFGSYIFPRYLEEIIGLNHEEVSKIHIESWTPDDMINSNKNKHIEAIISSIQFSGRTKDIVLIDDDNANIASAKKKGYTTIHAEGDYLLRMKKIAKVKTKNEYFNFYKSTSEEKTENHSIEKGKPKNNCNIL